MAVKTTIRTPMPIRIRAKQFTMFDALKGLKEAIEEKEHQYISKRILAEERIEEINRIISSIQVGNLINLTYYCKHGRYYRIRGSLNNVDVFRKEIMIDNIIIDFDDIYDIEIEREQVFVYM